MNGREVTYVLGRWWAPGRASRPSMPCPYIPIPAQPWSPSADPSPTGVSAQHPLCAVGLPLGSASSKGPEPLGQVRASRPSDERCRGGYSN